LPAVDLCEKDTAYEISAELPGMSEKDIKIKLSGDTLTLKGEKKDEHEEKKQDYFLTERRYGSFSRSFRLPDGIDADHIEASFAKGVLTVALPRTAEAQKREKAIDVNAA
jgi:HSP20 family protein